MDYFKSSLGINFGTLSSPLPFITCIASLALSFYPIASCYFWSLLLHWPASRSRKTLNPPRGSSSWELRIENVYNSAGGRITEGAIPTAILISLKDEDGDFVYNLEKFTLVKINDSYITSPIVLEEGSYTVEDFIVTGENDTSVYLTPKIGSKFENLVSTPLPYGFNIFPDTISTVVLDVIPSSLGTAKDFGYAEFTFNVVDLQKGLVAYYPFNGNAMDKSGNDLHGNVLGAQLTEDRYGKANRAYSFDGIDDRIEVDNNELLENQTYSLSAWLKASDSTGTIVSLSDFNPVRNNCGYYLSLKNGNLRGLSNIGVDNWVRNVDDDVVTLEEWHHVVFNCNGKTLELYKDGMLTSTLEFPHAVNYSEHNPLQIGTYATHAGATIYTGDLDDIRIYDRTLTVPEIKALYRE